MQIQKSHHVYWEKQGQDKLCGLNCTNSLLQGPYFKELDMLNIALQLDKDEIELLGDANIQSQNVADDGNYSIQVITTALQMHDKYIESIDSSLNKQHDMTQEVGFICNSDSHWFCIRKVFNVWFNFNSTNSQGPQIISDFYLSAFLLSIRQNGYSIFVVKGQFQEYEKNGSSQNLFPNQSIFTLEELQQIQQQNLKNKSFKLNIHGSDQASIDQAIQNSLKDNYKDDQDLEDFQNKFKKEEQNIVYFQGNSVSLNNKELNQDLQDKFQEIFCDQDMLINIQFSLADKFVENYKKNSDNQVMIQIRAPNGKNIQGYFDPYITMINDIYDFIIYECRDESVYGKLTPFKILNNYPKLELTNIYTTLIENAITTNTKLIFTFI